MNTHDCPGLAECDDHPRWRVHKYTAHSRLWFAVAPGRTWVFAPMYGTHAVALDYATSRARAEQRADAEFAEGAGR